MRVGVPAGVAVFLISFVANTRPMEPTPKSMSWTIQNTSVHNLIHIPSFWAYPPTRRLLMASSQAHCHCLMVMPLRMGVFEPRRLHFKPGA
jgi:hypothetical protein